MSLWYHSAFANIESVSVQFSSVAQSCPTLRPHESHAACQASLSITNSRSSPSLTSIESVMPSSHLILCRPLLLLPAIPPSIRVFSNESTLHMRWPKYWSFSFSIIPSKEHPSFKKLCKIIDLSLRQVFKIFDIRNLQASTKKKKNVINSYMLVTHIQQRVSILLSLFHFFTHTLFFFLSFFFFLGSCSLWNLSSPTPTPCSGPPENSLFSFCWNILNQMINIMSFHCKYFSLDSTS